jgi:hypothetical protein
MLVFAAICKALHGRKIGNVLDGRKQSPKRSSWSREDDAGFKHDFVTRDNVSDTLRDEIAC